MKDLEQVSVLEQREFIDSFDRVLCDMDGVIWQSYKPLPGASQALESLKNLGKTIKFVTNNDFTPTGYIAGYLNKNNFNGFTEEDVVSPPAVIIEYLKTIKFDKEIYLISSYHIRKEFEKNGFKLAATPPQEISENVEAILSHLEDNQDIGCVVLLIDFNATFMKIQKCLTYLKRNDMIWIVGPPDKAFPVGPKGPIFGPNAYVQVLHEISGREYLRLAKPTKGFNEFFVRKFNITEPKRVLFVGDTIDQDMTMAAIGGYRKLLVLTGMTKIEDVQNWKFDEELKPDYYINGLDSLRVILEQNYPSNKY